jgi:flagellar protein FlgJ
LDTNVESAAPIRPHTAASGGGNAPQALQEAAREFEAYMLKLLLSELRRGAGGGGLFPERSLAGYRMMLDDALARRAAEAGSFGLARQLLQQWEAHR